jgi:2-methylfumaryl-CoA isomerase
VEDFARPFDESGVTWSVFRSFKQAVQEDPDLSTRHPMFSLVEQPGIGEYLVPGSPFEFGEFERQPPNAGSRIRPAHRRNLSDILGMSDAEISRLHEQKGGGGPASLSEFSAAGSGGDMPVLVHQSHEQFFQPVGFVAQADHINALRR